MATAEEIVRTYLTALRDPDSLKDEQAITDMSQRLESATDVITRLELQEELSKLLAPSLESIEDEFVVHAKPWADASSIGAQAFAAEGVSTAVLRRAGFPIGRTDGRSRKSSSRRSSGTRVTTQSVVAAMPSTSFTVKQLKDISGASPAVVRKAVRQEQDAGRLNDLGTDPDHNGPGRAPTLYRKA
ncbi:MAG: hypothetical protein ACR2HR_17545 [Euzebya sp.]